METRRFWDAADGPHVFETIVKRWKDCYFWWRIPHKPRFLHLQISLILFLFNIEIQWTEMIYDMPQKPLYKIFDKSWYKYCTFNKWVKRHEKCVELNSVYLEIGWQVWLIVVWRYLTSWKYEMLVCKSNSCSAKIAAYFEKNIIQSYVFLHVIFN